MKLIIRKVNFVPYQDTKSKGFLGFLNIVLGDEDEDLIFLSSFGVYTKLDSANSLKLNAPARKMAGGLKFYFRILQKDLEDRIVEATKEELKRLNYFSRDEVELSEKNEIQNDKT